jgi:hypothetical protein
MFRFSLKKLAQMGVLVVVGEYLLLAIINRALTVEYPVYFYTRLPTQIVNLAVTEKPILRVAEAYTLLKKKTEFDQILQGQYPVQVRGSRPDFRTLDLQDKEGAKVGYVVKF